MSDQEAVAVALKNVFNINIYLENRNNFTAECSNQHLKTLLGTTSVQNALINSGYTICPSDKYFAISHSNKKIGKLYGNDNYVDINHGGEKSNAPDYYDGPIRQSTGKPRRGGSKNQSPAPPRHHHNFNPYPQKNCVPYQQQIPFPQQIFNPYPSFYSGNFQGLVSSIDKNGRAQWRDTAGRFCPQPEGSLITSHNKNYSSKQTPIENEEKIEYGPLPIMYEYVSKMDVDRAIKHGKEYFECLAIRTAPFISTLRDENVLLAKKMRDDFEIFYNRVNGKLDKENELWNEINELKEEWDEFKVIFDRKNERELNKKLKKMVL